MHFHSLDSEAFIKAFENIGGGIPANAIEQKTKVLMVTEAIQMLTPQDAVILTLFYDSILTNKKNRFMRSFKN